MSFILDALKKSESDRQRQNGPALYEMKVAQPRTQLPLWAIGLAILLAVNMVIVAWALLRRPSHDAATSPSTTTSYTAAAANTPVAPAASAPQNGPNPAALSAAQAGQAVGQAGQPAAPPAPQIASGASAALQSGAAVQSAAAQPAAGPSAAPPPPSLANAAHPTGPPVQAANAVPSGNPDDDAPATEPGQNNFLGFHARRGTADGIPLYADAATTAKLPELRLDLHAYSPNPQDRFVLLNMKKLHEGESTPEGVKVESITPDGVVVSHHGNRYSLPRQ